MRSRDIVASIFWLLVGAGLIYEGYRAELGTLQEPGSGFLIFWMGIVIVGLSLLLLFITLFKPAPAEEHPSPWFGPGLSKVLVISIALLLYAYALIPLGFLLTTFLFMFFLFKAINLQSWVVSISGAVISSLVIYLVFSCWLAVQLPEGILR
ncbi:MAG: tripartite tricarboxylate transporter TctB family protein [Thermodesulfobacteriota bacterium]